MRLFILFAIGAALGALLAATLINASARRNAWPRGVMQVMQHHVATLREAERAGRCADTSRAKSALVLLVEEVEPSTWGGAPPEAPFREYTQRLREAVNALPDSAAGCSALAPIVAKIGNACDGCHRQYR